MFKEQLLLGTLIITIIVVFHVVSLVGFVYLLRKLKISQKRFGMISLVGFSVFVIIGIHTAEAWTWAVIYYLLGEFNEFERALYFSVVTSTTLGFGDITLSERWQLLSSFEAMGGLLLFGVSTAFLIALMQHLIKDSEL